MFNIIFNTFICKAKFKYFPIQKQNYFKIIHVREVNMLTGFFTSKIEVIGYCLNR